MLRCPAELREILIDLADPIGQNVDLSRLAELLRDDPAARCYYIQFMQMHARLELLSTPPLAALPLDEFPAEHTAGQPADSRWAVAARWLADRWHTITHPSPGALGVVYAVLFLSVGLWLLSLATLPEPTAINGPWPSASPDVPARWAARILRVSDAVTESGDPLQVGERLPNEREIKLHRGLAELQFANGTRMVVEGPSLLKIETADSCHLEIGRISTTVPPQAMGFSVHTPVATVVDLGTEFGVEVESSGATLARVFQGKVGFQPNSVDGEQGQVLIISAGQGARLSSASGEIELLAAAKEKFTRRLPDVYQIQAHQAGGLVRSDDAHLLGGNNRGVRRIGSSIKPNVGLGLVYLFRLPTLDADATITSAALGFTCTSIDGDPQFSVDVYGLGAIHDGVVRADWFYEGSLDSSLARVYRTGGDQPVVQIAEGVLQPSTKPARVVIDSPQLKTFLQSLYDEGFQGGSFAVVRLNADSSNQTGPRQTGYNVAHPPTVTGTTSAAQMPRLTMRVSRNQNTADDDSTNPEPNL